MNINILRALVYVLTTFLFFRIKQYITLLCFGPYFFVKSTGYGPGHRQTVKRQRIRLLFYRNGLGRQIINR